MNTESEVSKAMESEERSDSVALYIKCEIDHLEANDSIAVVGITKALVDRFMPTFYNDEYLNIEYLAGSVRDFANKFILDPNFYIKKCIDSSDEINHVPDSEVIDEIEREIRSNAVASYIMWEILMMEMNDGVAVRGFIKALVYRYMPSFYNDKSSNIEYLVNHVRDTANYYAANYDSYCEQFIDFSGETIVTYDPNDKVECEVTPSEELNKLIKDLKPILQDDNLIKR